MPNDKDRTVILVPVDFSEPSRHALAWALEYAARVPAELHLLHVVEYQLSDLVETSFRPGEDQLTAVAHHAEATLKHAFPEAEGARVVRHVALGRPVPEILRIAEKVGTALIVIGAHGRTAHDLFLGSTTEKVVRQARCPVVCVKVRPQ